jgi:hypothetical protein
MSEATKSAMYARTLFVFRKLPKATDVDNLRMMVFKQCTEGECCYDPDGSGAILCHMQLIKRRREGWILKQPGGYGLHFFVGEEADRVRDTIRQTPRVWKWEPGMEEPIVASPDATQVLPPVPCAAIVNDHSTTNNTANLNVDNTKIFNLNVYLNEECRNAPNLKEFVAGVVASFKDIDYENDRQTWDYAEMLAHMPYAEGVSRLLADKLGELDKLSRPIQCSDEKRHRFHIKDDEEWQTASIDDAVGTPFRNAIYQLGQIRAGYALQWKLKHGSDPALDTERTHILRNVSSGVTKKQTDASRHTISGKLAKETAIDKTM